MAVDESKPLPFALTELDRKILSMTDEEYTPHDWDSIKAIIRKAPFISQILQPPHAFLSNAESQKPTDLWISAATHPSYASTSPGQAA